MTRSFARRIGVLEVAVVVVVVAAAVVGAGSERDGSVLLLLLLCFSTSSALSTLSSWGVRKEFELVVWASARLAARK